MVPTDDAMITRQMLYPGLPVPATAAFAMTSSVHSRLPLLNRTLECSLIRRVDSTLAPAHVAMAASAVPRGQSPADPGHGRCPSTALNFGHGRTTENSPRVPLPKNPQTKKGVPQGTPQITRKFRASDNAPQPSPTSRPMQLANRCRQFH